MDTAPDRKEPAASTGRSRIPRAVLLGIGWLSVALGVIGIFVPGLPTTSFLLIAAWCFWRSSPRAHAWLLGHPVLGPYIRDYLSGKGMPLRAKVVAISAMWIMCGVSAWFFIASRVIDVIVLGCAALGTWLVLRVPARRPDAA